MNHIWKILRKGIRSWLVRVTSHIRKEITPVNNVPALIQKNEGLSRARGCQSSGLKEYAIRADHRPSSIGARKPAKIEIHRHAADSSCGNTIDHDVRSVGGAFVDRRIFYGIWPERMGNNIQICVPVSPVGWVIVHVGRRPGILVLRI